MSRSRRSIIGVFSAFSAFSAFLAFAACVLGVGVPGGCERTQSSSAEEDADRTTAPPVDKRTYEVISTVRYNGRGVYSHYAAGLMVFGKQKLSPDRVAYHCTFDTDVISRQGSASGRITSPTITVIRNPKTERMVGGHPITRSSSALANAALWQVKQPIRPDGQTRRRMFTFRGPSEFPRSLTYTIRAARQRFARNSEVIVIRASAPVRFKVPGSSEMVDALHRVFCVTDMKMDELLFYCSNFTAKAPKGQSGTVSMATLVYQVRGDRPVALCRLDSKFVADGLADLELSQMPLEARSDAAMPVWALHAVAVRDMTDMVLGVAIEKKSNPVFTITLGTALVVDTAVSLGTGALQYAGVIDWQYPGALNLTGQGIGFGAAKVVETGTGRDVDEQRWQELGGLGGDVAGFFIPSKAAQRSIKVSITHVPRAAATLGRHAQTVMVGAKYLVSSDRITRGVSALKTSVDAAGNLMLAAAVGGEAKSAYDKWAGSERPAPIAPPKPPRRTAPIAPPKPPGRTAPIAPPKPPGRTAPIAPPKPPVPHRPNDKARTPREAIINYVNALKTGDEALYFRTVKINQGKKEVIRAGFRMTSAMIRFQDKLLAAYRSQLPAGTVSVSATMAKLKSAKIDIRGDRATAQAPGVPRPAKLVRAGGYWRVDISGIADNPALKRVPTDKIVRMFTAQARVFDEARAKIGRSGYDAKRVMREMKAAMAKAVGAALR